MIRVKWIMGKFLEQVVKYHLNDLCSTHEDYVLHALIVIYRTRQLRYSVYLLSFLVNIFVTKQVMDIISVAAVAPLVLGTF